MTRVVAGLTVALLALAACTSSDGATGNGDAGAPTVLTIGRAEGPQTNSSNPFVITSSAMSLGYGYVIYEPLVQVNKLRPSDDPIPWLAESFEWNDAYTELVYTIRDGVTWHDGQALTAEDVAYTFELRRDNDQLNTNGVDYGDIAQDGNTVTLTFENGQFTSTWRIYDVPIVPKHIWENIADPATDLNQDPVGTGPFTLEAWTQQAVTLKAYPGYWAGQINEPPFYVAPSVQEVRYTSFTDNAAETTALVNDDIQWGWNFIADYESVYVAADPANHKVLFVPDGICDDFFMMNTETKPFNNVALRQALSLAHDRQLHTDLAMAGIAPPALNPTGIADSAADYIAPEFKGQTLSPDLAGAKKILLDAGYTYNGDALIDPDGERVTATLTNPAAWSDYLAGIQVVAETLKSLGVDASVEGLDANQWQSDLRSGDFQGSMRSTDPAGTPWTMYDMIMDGNLYAPLGSQATLGNFGRYQNPAADEALHGYQAASTEADRDKYMADIQRIWVEDVPALAIDARPTMAEYSSRYWVGWPSEADPYASPEIQRPGVVLVILSLKPAS
jgi:peptide/nickel transport system substrate-binding protein